MADSPLIPLHTEEIRCSIERAIAGRFVENASPLYGYRPTPDELRALRRRLLASALQLTPELAPGPCKLLDQARATLGVERPVEAYQLPGADPAGVQARLYFDRERVILTIEGRMLSLLDAPGQLSVFGHELGHHLAHALPPPWLCHDNGMSPWRHGDYDDLRDALQMACELTADRYGLLACQSLWATLRVEMVDITGTPAAALDWPPGAYLKQCVRLMAEIRERGERIHGRSHPEHSMRAYAAWLFSESDVYQKLTGKGPGTRSLRQIDAELAGLMGLPLALLQGADPAPPRRPAPRPARPAPPFVEPPGPPDLPRPASLAPLPEVRGAGGPSPLASAIGGLLGRRPRPPTPEPGDALDDLFDDEKELRARFDELERRGRS